MDGETPPGVACNGVHCYNTNWSDRLWFPCVDSYQEVCTWNVDVTVPSSMIAVSCGELCEQVRIPPRDSP